MKWGFGYDFFPSQSVLWIYDILVRIRICGSVPMILLFSSVAFKMSTKLIFFLIFFPYYLLFLKPLHQSLKKKSHKEVKKQYKSRVFLLFFLDKRRTWIRILEVQNIRNRIHIHNTALIGRWQWGMCHFCRRSRPTRFITPTISSSTRQVWSLSSWLSRFKYRGYVSLTW